MNKSTKEKIYLTAYPNLIAEWHPEKNGDLDPTKITHASHKKVWWICRACGREWETTPGSRAIHSSGCPYCSGRRAIPGETDLASQRPDLAAEWSPENDRGPGDVSVGSKFRALWICSAYGHEWETTPNKRSRGAGCPVCVGQRTLAGFNDLATTHPKLAEEWSARNEFGPESVSAGSDKRVWWVCRAGHEWVSVVKNRTRGNGCPVCSNRTVLPGFNDLATTHPELSKEWSPINEFGPDSVSAGSNKRVWWVCSLEHTWRATLASRALLGSGCPKCCLNHTSNIEGELHRLLSEHFPDAEQGVRVGRWSVDVLLSEEKVVVEYDGAYFHKDRVEHDTQKTLDLITRGYGVVRVRERGREYTLPPLEVNEPHYLELTHAYSPDWSGLSDIVDRITSWVSSK